jgi:hypothetical protein
MGGLYRERWFDRAADIRAKQDAERQAWINSHRRVYGCKK